MLLCCCVAFGLSLQAEAFHVGLQLTIEQQLHSTDPYSIPIANQQLNMVTVVYRWQSRAATSTGRHYAFQGLVSDCDALIRDGGTLTANNIQHPLEKPVTAEMSLGVSWRIFKRDLGARRTNRGIPCSRKSYRAIWPAFAVIMSLCLSQPQSEIASLSSPELRAWVSSCCTPNPFDSASAEPFTPEQVFGRPPCCDAAAPETRHKSCVWRASCLALPLL